MDSYLELRDITKTFYEGQLVANNKISLKIKTGSIHGIIGENGAGKSTAMKVLYGMYEADSGSILLKDKILQLKSPSDAIKNGIGMVHQHFMLAPPLTVLENFLLEIDEYYNLALIPKIWRPIKKLLVKNKLQKLAKDYGLPLPMDEKVESLPVGLQQRIEILKLLYKKCEILILDEPTAVLTPKEIEDFFKQLTVLKKEGRTIILITHKLKEITAIADRVTVFKGGKVVAERDVIKTSADELGQLMVGQRIEKKHAAAAKTNHTKILEVNQLSFNTKLKDISFSVAAGEIVGIAGVEGNGQIELQQLILQPNKKATGNIKIHSRETLGKKVLSASAIRNLGIGYLPDDRIKQGLLSERPLFENFLLGHQKKSQFQKFGILDYQKLKSECKKSLETFNVKPQNIDALAGSLSGGNQQKFVVSRELWQDPKFILAAHPTRGVDIGAIDFIHAQLREMQKKGSGILLISSELDELMDLCDRILVMYSGKIHAEFSKGQFTESIIGIAMGGGDI